MKHGAVVESGSCGVVHWPIQYLTLNVQCTAGDDKKKKKNMITSNLLISFHQLSSNFILLMYPALLGLFLKRHQFYNVHSLPVQQYKPSSGIYHLRRWYQPIATLRTPQYLTSKHGTNWQTFPHRSVSRDDTFCWEHYAVHTHTVVHHCQ